MHRGTLSRVNAWRRGAPECSRAHRGSNGQLWASQSEKKTEKKKKKKKKKKIEQKQKNKVFHYKIKQNHENDP